jgi:potassium-transporting ATPase potassium-binding subunit
MSFRGWFEVSCVLAAVVAFAWPLSGFISAIFGGKKTFLAPIENALYKLAGIDPVGPKY